MYKIFFQLDFSKNLSSLWNNLLSILWQIWKHVRVLSWRLVRFLKNIKSAIYHKACVNIWIIRRKNVNTLSYSFLLLCTYWKSIGPSFSGLEKKLKIRSVWENAYHDNDVYDNNDDNKQGTEVLRGGILICIIISLHYTLPVIITIVISIVFSCISFPINNDRNGYKCQE